MYILYFSSSLQTFRSLINSLLSNLDLEDKDHVYDAPAPSLPASRLSIIDIHRPQSIDYSLADS